MLLSSPSSCSCSYSYSPQIPPQNSHPQFVKYTVIKPNRLPRFRSQQSAAAAAAGALVEKLESSPEDSRDDDEEYAGNLDAERFNFDSSFDSTELRRFDSPAVGVVELEELPEQWRRSKLAWLCKELPSHKHATVIRVLNAQRKWIRQDDANYVVVHCIRIRENETAFRVYKWMMKQHWFRFDFGLATKLADYMGRQQKFLKCREIFDDILNQGRVPNESTFHILVGAYLSASSSEGCLDEACNIYNRMIQLGGYRPRLSLHNALFRALVSKPGASSKEYLKQAEFIFHNLTTCGLDIHKDIYGSLIWLHSNQDAVDRERIASLRAEMRSRGFEEGREVLVSVLRACSKEGDVEGAERAWKKLISLDAKPPSQAFVYFMEVYGKAGEHMTSFELFRKMQELVDAANLSAYLKILEVVSKARNQELAESLMAEFVNSGLKPLAPSFKNLMEMHSDLGLHDKLEEAFMHCLEKCRPSRTMYNIYLESLVQIGNLERAEEIFSQMLGNAAIGVNARSCNIILGGYLGSGDPKKIGKLHYLMSKKKYVVEPHLKEELNKALSLIRKASKPQPKSKLDEDQRETLVGMLLGGLNMVPSEEKKKRHAVQFEFRESSNIHTVLKMHIYEAFHEWLESRNLQDGSHDDDNVPSRFTTIMDLCFNFYAEQFWTDGRPAIPKLIHRWLSAQVLAYWYMYGGQRTPKGDILLKVKGSEEGVLKIMKVFKANSLECRVKRKGRVFWIGFEGSNAGRFWNVVEPYILDDVQDLLRPLEVAEMRSGASFVSGGSDDDEAAADRSDDGK